MVSRSPLLFFHCHRLNKQTYKGLKHVWPIYYPAFRTLLSLRSPGLFAEKRARPPSFPHWLSAFPSDFERAITIDPDNAYPAYLNRAWIHAERGAYGPALADCNRVLLANYKNEDAYTYRARVYYLQGEYELALADCQRALAIDTECAIAYGVRGLVTCGQEQYEDALADFTRARDMGHNLFWLDSEYNEAYNKVNRI